MADAFGIGTVAISAVSLLTAAWAGISARESAKASRLSAEAARDAADIDRARRHQEATPEFTAEYLPHPQFAIDRRHGLEITLEGPQGLGAVEFSFPRQRHDDLRPTGFVEGGEHAEVARVDGPIEVGTSWLVWLAFDDPAPHGDVRLLATCQLGDEQWSVLTYFHVSPTPQQHRRGH